MLRSHFTESMNSLLQQPYLWASFSQNDLIGFLSGQKKKKSIFPDTAVAFLIARLISFLNCVFPQQQSLVAFYRTDLLILYRIF